MKVVLNKDIPKLGYKGDIVNVKAGYFRNFLQPKKLVEMVTATVLRVAEKRKEQLVMKKQQIMENAKEVLAKLQKLKISIKAKASTKGKLYAAVTEKDVIEAVEVAAKVKLEKTFLKMEHFKEVGSYTVLVHLGEGLEAKIKVSVKKA